MIPTAMCMYVCGVRLIASPFWYWRAMCFLLLWLSRPNKMPTLLAAPFAKVSAVTTSCTQLIATKRAYY